MSLGKYLLEDGSGNLELEGQRSIADSIAPVLTEANPRVQSAAAPMMIKIVINLADAARRARRRKRGFATREDEHSEETD